MSGLGGRSWEKVSPALEPVAQMRGMKNDDVGVETSGKETHILIDEFITKHILS